MAAGEAMLAGFDGALTLVLVLGMMTLGVDWRLAAVALLPFPLMAYGFWRISRHVHQASADALQRFSALNDHVQETLSGVRTLRALGLEERNRASMARLAAATLPTPACKRSAGKPPSSRTVGMTLSAASVLTLALGGYLGVARQPEHRPAHQLFDVPGPADLADVCRRLGTGAAGTRQSGVGTAGPHPVGTADGGRPRSPSAATAGLAASWRSLRFAYPPAATAGAWTTSACSCPPVACWHW